MKTVFHPSDERGHADHGWLNARHSFSFAQWYDPTKIHFGLLRVLNDDIIAPSMGFGTHPHDNMEIVTIPLEGMVAHRDNTGGQGLISQGEVQIMSAGTGILHSEFNGSNTVYTNLLQLWVFPKEENITPRYDQRDFKWQHLHNALQIVVSPLEADQALWINQDARFVLGQADADHMLTYNLLKPGNGVYVFVISGSLETGGLTLNARDAAGISETDSISLEAKANTRFLLVDVPMLP